MELWQNDRRELVVWVMVVCGQDEAHRGGFGLVPEFNATAVCKVRGQIFMRLDIVLLVQLLEIMVEALVFVIQFGIIAIPAVPPV